MSKITLSKPLLCLVYGYPGAGKTHFARQLAEMLGAAHVQGDRIRSELFENPSNDKQENQVISQLMEYMTEEFLNAGVSVIFDNNAMRFAQRRLLRELARKTKAQVLLVWIQIDQESAIARLEKRDRRRIDDKYAVLYDKQGFTEHASYMQNPKNEDYIVISGKHTFNTQRSAVMKKLYELGIASGDSTSSNVGKPGLVNLIPPAAGRVDMSRRNIVIR